MTENTDDAALNLIESRISELESGNRRIRYVCIVVSVTIAGVFAMGQAGTEPKKLEAERFSIVDAEGKERASLGLEKDGTVALTLLGRQGGLSKLSMTKEGLPSLVLEDPSRKGRVHVGVSDLKGASDLTLFQDGAPRARFQTDLDGLPSLSLLEKSADGVKPARPQAVFGLSKAGTPYVTLSDRNGVRLWSKP